MRANEAEAFGEAYEGQKQPRHLDIPHREARDEHEINGAVADDLVGDLQAVRLGVLGPRFRQRHVGAAGFEPAAPGSQSRCATGLRYAPKVLMHSPADGRYGPARVPFLNLENSADEVGKNKVKLTIEVPTADVEKILGRTYKRLAGQVKVPGVSSREGATVRDRPAAR